jgi:hypothetical protein
MVKRLSPERLRSFVQGERRKALMDRFAISSAICVPVRVRGKVTAALSIASSHSERVLDTRDLQTAQEIAHLAIDTALYRVHRRPGRAAPRQRQGRIPGPDVASCAPDAAFGGAKILADAIWTKQGILPLASRMRWRACTMIEDLLVLPAPARARVENRSPNVWSRRCALPPPAQSSQDAAADSPVMADTTYLEVRVT